MDQCSELRAAAAPMRGRVLSGHEIANEEATARSGKITIFRSENSGQPLRAKNAYEASLLGADPARCPQADCAALTKNMN
jgi:hypothetical protein